MVVRMKKGSGAVPYIVGLVENEVDGSECRFMIVRLREDDCDAFVFQVTVGIIACVTPTTTTVASSIGSSLPTTVRATAASTVTPVSSTAVQCIYTDWTDWTSCTVTCGNGTQTRARNVVAGFCDEALQETRVCQMEPCPCIFTRETYISTYQQPPPADSKPFH